MSTGMIILVCLGGLAALCVFGSIVAAIAIPNLLAAKLSSNEIAAMATLRNLTSAQAQFQVSGFCDVDGDGVGEYGTFVEMTGTGPSRAGVVEASAGTLAGSSFTEGGRLLQPAILSPSLAAVGPDGIVTKAGYCFRIVLPDNAESHGWVHETYDGSHAGLTGGTGAIGTDAAETTWCAFAWPVAVGNSGNRVFFVSDYGDVWQCDNDLARWSGRQDSVPLVAAELVEATEDATAPVQDSAGNTWRRVN
jgi:hypothetical protein